MSALRHWRSVAAVAESRLHFAFSACMSSIRGMAQRSVHSFVRPFVRTGTWSIAWRQPITNTNMLAVVQFAPFIPINYMLNIGRWLARRYFLVEHTTHALCQDRIFFNEILWNFYFVITSFPAIVSVIYERISLVKTVLKEQ